MKPIKMFGDRVLLKKLPDVDTVTKDKIVLPKGLKEQGSIQVLRGEVVNKGGGELADGHTIKVDVEIGDIVYYPALGPVLKVELPGDPCQDYVITKYSECFGKEINDA